MARYELRIIGGHTAHSLASMVLLVTALSSRSATSVRAFGFAASKISQRGSISLTHLATTVPAFHKSRALASSRRIVTSIRPRGGRLGSGVAYPSPRWSALSTSASATATENDRRSEDGDGGGARVPITLLSGFLGSGKTSCLTNLLENRRGIRVGVVVNDVASVNIDAKLISNPGGGPGGSGDDPGAMLDAGGTVELQNGCACCSLADELLVSMQTLLDGRTFDAVVVELSGVADPVAVQNNWKDATMMQHPATKLADLNRVVTVVDASTFGTDWMTWNTAGEREGWTLEGDDCSGQRKVTELLAEQVEAADVVLVNKVDLAGKEQTKVATSVAKGLNANADMLESTYGKVPIEEILGTAATLAQKDDISVSSADASQDGGHSHSHEHSSEAKSESSPCTDPDCGDPTHDHSHSHDHDCSDPECDDPTHDHSHSHDHASTSTDDLGIGSFVYKANVPFHAARLLNLLNKWPVPIKDELDLGQIKKAAREGYVVDDGLDSGSPFVGVLRSKGFCWMAPSSWVGAGGDAWRHDTAMYWSHAGRHFGITTAGKWWGTVSKEQMKGFFATNPKEYDRILREDFVTDEWGDRRQELVFIGTNLDEQEITHALNECLLSEKEMDKYRQQLRNFIDTTFTAEAVGATGPSLFDVGGTDHLDV